MMRHLFATLALIVAIVGMLAAPDARAQYRFSDVHPAWEFDDGTAKFLIKAKEGRVSGFFVSGTGRKSWSVSGNYARDGKMVLTRYVSPDEWKNASAVLKARALQEVGSDKPGFMASPVELQYDPERNELTGFYVRERLLHDGDTYRGIERVYERLHLLPIRDLLKALLWAAIASGVAAALLSMGLDFIPVVGDIKGLIEGLTGRDSITGDELAGWERALGAIPFIGGAIGLGVAGAKLTKRGGELVDFLGDMFRGLMKGERAMDGAGDVLRHADDFDGLGRHVDDLDDFGDAGRHLDEAGDAVRPVGDLSRTGCFVAGTLVAVPGGSVPIERIQPGEDVLAAQGAHSRPNQDDAVPRKVLAVRSEHAARLVRVTAADGGAQAQVDCTPRHAFATPAGYVAAEELTIGSSLVRRGGGTARVVSVEPVDGSAEVFTLSVEDDRCFYVSTLELLVHNHCEWFSQGQMEKLFDADDSMTTLFRNKDGSPMREPGFRDGNQLGFRRPGRVEAPEAGEAARRLRMAESVGVDTRGWYLDDWDADQAHRWLVNQGERAPGAARYTPDPSQAKALQRDAKRAINQELNRKLEGVTFPDDVRQWENPRTGDLENVAFELKTPQKRDGTVGNFFRNHHEDIVKQAGGRVANMGDYTHELVIDLRNIGQSADAAAMELKATIARNGSLSDTYSRVRFIEGSTDVPKMTPPYDLATGNLY